MSPLQGRKEVATIICFRGHLNIDLKILLPLKIAPEVDISLNCLL